MGTITLKRIIICISFILVGAIVWLLFFPARSFFLRQIQNKGQVEAVFMSPRKYQKTFAEALKSAEASAGPFRRAGQLMKTQEYDAALEALDESLQNSTRSIERSMVYDRRQEIYNRLENLEKELEAIEDWFAEAGKSANNPEFERRAAEIRSLLAAKDHDA